MNRAQRRALASGKGQARPKWGTKKAINYTAVVRTVADRRVLEPKDFLDDFLDTEYRIQRLINGTGTPSDYDEVSLRIGMGAHRAEQVSDVLLKDMIKAVEALTNCRNRYFRTGSFGFTNPERLDLLQGQMILQELVKNSSRVQMQTCWKACLRNIDAAMNERKAQGLPELPTKEHP